HQLPHRGRPGVGDHRRRRIDRREDAQPRVPARALRRVPAGAHHALRDRDGGRPGAALRSPRAAPARAGHALDEARGMTAKAPLLEAVDVGYIYTGRTPTQALEGL